MPRHFITGSELSADELNGLLERALELKAAPYSSDALRKRSVALIFQKPSTRTRVSFEAGITELGGYPMVLRTDELQLTRAGLRGLRAGIGHAIALYPNDPLVIGSLAEVSRGARQF